MKLSDFDYPLDKNLIAQYPLAKRDQARLMVINRTKLAIHHDIFSNIDQYLPNSSCLVLNESKVIPARLLGTRQSGGKVEVFLLKQVEERLFHAMLSPLGRLKIGEKIFIAKDLYVEIVDKDVPLVRFNKGDVLKELAHVGHIPLPPYIKRPDEKKDQKDYQTVYAKNIGSVASPTAGLHFTNKLLSKLETNGYAIAKVTLHVNLATFKPVQVEDITTHPMHYEDFEVEQKSWEYIQKQKESGNKIVAVGTTSCRVLESIVNLRQISGSTNLFIYPGYRFNFVDALITNFHTPMSTLLMLVYAFGGVDLMRRAYAEAIEKKYRLFSYGDAMLIL